MRNSLIFFLVVLIIVIFSCTEDTKDNTPAENNTITLNQNPDTSTLESKLKYEGANMVIMMRRNLEATLNKSIREQGIAKAVEFCNTHPMPFADSLAIFKKAEISRVSHKVRNAANKANTREMELINKYQNQAKEEEVLMPVLAKNGNQFTYYSPIMISQPMCLNCHGEPELQIKPEDYIVINMLYPNDSAVGFNVGDLRGLWKVTFTDSQAIPHPS